MRKKSDFLGFRSACRSRGIRGLSVSKLLSFVESNMTATGAFRHDSKELSSISRERGRLLRNLPGITRKREMDKVEGQKQACALEELVGIYGKNHRFNAADVCRIHKVWLASIYSWAGQYRQVNITKGNFSFAAAQHIPALMSEFERGPLAKFTPCNFQSEDEIGNALAVVHAELVLIHPFRDGNGRAARLFAILMAVQAGLPPLDFGGLKGKMKQKYFSAVRAALERNYEPMKQIFRSVIRRTMRRFR